jgi:hypothetical protein
MDYCASQFKIKSARGLVNSFVLRHSDKAIQLKSGAQEGQRSQVPGVFLERITQDMHEYLQGCVAELVFNLDEVGISDWEDRKTKESYCPRRDAWCDDISWNISKCETHFGDCFPVSGWRITSPLYSEIAKFPNCPRASQTARCSLRQGFRLEIQPEALLQRSHPPRLYQNHPLIIY